MTKGRVLFTDIESVDWDKFLVAVVRDVDTGEEWVCGTPFELADLVRELGGQWLAHFGGGFDHLFILDALPYCATVIPAGSRVLSARFFKKRGDFRATLRDTWPLWSVKLATLGDWLKLPKIDSDAPLRAGGFAPLDAGHLEKFEPSAVVEYCRRDVEIGCAAVKATREFLAELGVKQMRWTSGGNAVEIFSALEPAARAAMESSRISARAVQELADAGVTKGGRVEVFWYGELRKVYKYDICSSYPYSFLEGDLPIGLVDGDTGERPALHLARWRRYDPRCPAPVLGLPVKGGQASRGIGELRAWVTPEELADLEGDPEVSVDKLERTLRPAAWISAGKVFARRLYELKSQGVPWAKLFLNSFHGKLSQKPQQIQYYGDGEKYIEQQTILQAVESEMSLDEKEKRWAALCPWHYQPLAAATVFGRARSRLYRAAKRVQAAGGEVYYCDTDSLHCSLPPEKFAAAGNAVGTALGEWKYEGAGPGCYLAPKLYLAGKDKDGRPVIRARGIRKAAEFLNATDYARVAALPRVENHRGTFSEADGIEWTSSSLSKFAASVRDGGAPFRTELSRRMRVVATGKRIDSTGRAWYRI
jgi:hypothetical protein